MPAYDMVAGGLALRIEHPQPIFTGQQARLLLGAYLPGVKILPPGHRWKKTDARVVFRQALNRRVTRHGIASGGTGVWLYDQWNGEGSMLDLIHVTYSLARLCWLNRELYPVHSACVGPEDEGNVLILGHSGSGKTAVTLRLASKGWKVFSGNKTLVSIRPNGTMEAMAGTRTITTKAKDAERHHPAAAGNVDYQERRAFLLPEECMVAPGIMTVPIKAVAMVRLNDGAEECTRLTAGSALHKLYPLFMDAVNADTIVGGKVFVGTPAKQTENRLVLKLAPALAQVPAYSVTGSMEFVAQSLMEL